MMFAFICLSFLLENIVAEPLYQPEHYVQQRPNILLTDEYYNPHEIVTILREENNQLKRKLQEEEKEKYMLSGANKQLTKLLQDEKNRTDYYKEENIILRKDKDLLSQELSIVIILSGIEEMENTIGLKYYKMVPVKKERNRFDHWRYIFANETKRPCIKVLLDSIHSKYPGNNSAEKETNFLRKFVKTVRFLRRQKHHYIWARLALRMKIQLGKQIEKEDEEIISLFEKAHEIFSKEMLDSNDEMEQIK